LPADLPRNVEYDLSEVATGALHRGNAAIVDPESDAQSVLVAALIQSRLRGLHLFEERHIGRA
jgi:hypothetical protein